MKIEIRNRFDNKIILSGKYASIKECLEKNRGADLEGADLGSANLWGADLGSADLRGADLGGANLGGTNLGGTKNYLNSHYFFQEIVKRQKLDTFTQKEWSILGQIIIHKLCWDSIRKRFNKSAIKIFKKLSKVGFNAWEAKYEES